MQSYDGPKNRKLTKFNGEYGFRKDGRVNYLENREIYMTQTFKIEEKRLNDSKLPDAWFFNDDEHLMAPRAGDAMPLTELPPLGRLCLNRTLTDVRFKPDNSFNSLELDNECQIRLAPLLTDKLVFDNVTREPTFAEHKKGPIPNVAIVAMTAYNRLWFGFIQDDEDEDKAKG